MHELKTWPEPFRAIQRGDKTFEIRNADRDFSVGDELRLFEYLHEENRYTGSALTATVTYLVKPGEWGLPSNVCVMGIKLKPVSAPAVRKDIAYFPIVIALNKQRFVDWCRNEGISQHDVIYVANARTLRGLYIDPKQVVKIPGWLKRPDAEEIRLELEYCTQKFYTVRRTNPVRPQRR